MLHGVVDGQQPLVLLGEGVESQMWHQAASPNSCFPPFQSCNLPLP
jgi:hypothetical protein